MGDEHEHKHTHEGEEGCCADGHAGEHMRNGCIDHERSHEHEHEETCGCKDGRLHEHEHSHGFRRQTVSQRHP